MQCSWQALLLTAIIQCSHTSEANFLLVISPQFILSGQNHSSQSDLYSVNQFFVSRKTPLGPWCAVFMLLVSVIAGQTFLGKSPSILTLETRHNPLIGCLGQASITKLTPAWLCSLRTMQCMCSCWTRLRRSGPFLLGFRLMAAVIRLVVTASRSMYSLCY